MASKIFSFSLLILVSILPLKSTIVAVGSSFFKKADRLGEEVAITAFFGKSKNEVILR